MWTIWCSELRTTVRQRSFYSFSFLWIAVLTLLFLLQKSSPSLTGYTNTTGTIANIALYIIPLFMLIISSFSIANEMENGQWKLLSTYPISTLAYFIGKFAGQLTAQVIVFTFSFGISVIIGLISGSVFSIKWLWSIYSFCICLLFFFLNMGATFACAINTRWKALSISVVVWFFLIMIWPTMLIAILGMVPYTWISPLMKWALFLNPAEFVRVSFVVSLDAGAIFGQAYDSLVTVLNSDTAIVINLLYVIVFVSINLLFATIMLDWRRRQ